MKLPMYAAKADPNRRVTILCLGECLRIRHAEITDHSFNKLTMTIKYGLVAACLVCGFEATDTQNWSAR